MNNNTTIYKQWEDGFLVRRMTPEDALVAQGWYAEICPTSCDLSLALGLYPPDSDGFYSGEYKGELVATAIRIPAADGVYYGSYYYVVEKCRSKGFGKRLRDDVAAPRLGDNILAIDAHDNLLQMNMKRGYKEAFKVTGYQGVPKVNGKISEASIQRISDIDFKKLLDFDDQCYVRPGSEIRKALLTKWTTIEGGLTCVALDSNGDVIGFGCRRPASAAGNHLIGPLYAETYDVAQDILCDLTEGIPNTNIMINICNPNKDAVKLMETFGLSEDLHMIRMHLNGDPQELNSRVFAITSIDICGF